jgi:hypothetical protein
LPRRTKLNKPKAQPFVGDVTQYLTRRQPYEVGSFSDIAKQPGVNIQAVAVAVPVNVSENLGVFPISTSAYPDDKRATLRGSVRILR